MERHWERDFEIFRLVPIVLSILSPRFDQKHEICGIAHRIYTLIRFHPIYSFRSTLSFCSAQKFLGFMKRNSFSRRFSSLRSSVRFLPPSPRASSNNDPPHKRQVFLPLFLLRGRRKRRRKIPFILDQSY